MCCTISHSLELINLTNDSVVCHELVLFKGVVRNLCNETQIQLKTLDGEVCGTSNVALHTGLFKILHQLGSGIQELVFCYCTASIRVKCEFVPQAKAYKIQPLYIVCKGHNGTFNSSATQSGSIQEACSIIDLNMKLLQCLYAEKLNECGFGRKTFSLKSRCQLFESNLPATKALEFTQDQLWDHFAYEIINSDYGNDRKLKFVAFISCTKYDPIKDGDFSYDNIKKHTKGNAALGGGGLALFGSGYFYSWPSKFEDIRSCFENTNLIDLDRFADDSNYRRTYAGVYATSLGAVCHEIGHIFDLGHTTDGIMGSGFDYLNRVFTSSDMTECLPKRVIGRGPSPESIKYTRIERKPNRFLEKYHEQRSNKDSFYFTRNCAVILAYHRWLRDDQVDDNYTSLEFDKSKMMVVAETPLKLVEIRCLKTCLVKEFYEFIDTKLTCQFELHQSWGSKVFQLFAICIDGTTRRWDIDGVE